MTECSICKTPNVPLRIMPYGNVCPFCHFIIGPGFMGSRAAEKIYKIRTKNLGVPRKSWR